MQSKLKLLEQRIAELEAENAKLGTEKAEIEVRNVELLKQVMEKDTKCDAENTELKSRVRKLEARLAILEQDVTKATGQPQNDKDAIAEDKEIDDFPEEPANVPYFVITQLKRCKPDHKVNDVVLEVPASSMLSEEKKIDSFLDKINKKKVSDKIRKRKRKKKLQNDSQKEPDLEILIVSLDSTTFLNEKNGQDYSSIANEQRQTGEVASQSDKAFDIEIPEFSLEQDLADNTDEVIGDSSKISPDNSLVIPYDARAPYINVALKKYPYLSLFNSDIHNDRYEFKNSGLCPGCGKKHNKEIRLPENSSGEKLSDVEMSTSVKSQRFSFLSLSDSSERGERFNLNSSTLCPLCNGEHKKKVYGII
ncbi:hypothetical protein RhiirA4_476785 [Rhizophagus irregularis]|uniref:Uncharacterized protein n=1 Tax=Rhizophagus irregularis TaxID=588596 RepID=A0A2I1HC51_9GLOM|nr:hypothetical protein RhiirA4_476785 [Rhizophagus irregularis]